LVEDGVEGKAGRGDVGLAHDAGDVLDDGQVDAVDAEAAEEHELLELVEAGGVAAWVVDGLRAVAVEPLE